MSFMARDVCGVIASESGRNSICQLLGWKDLAQNIKIIFILIVLDILILHCYFAILGLRGERENVGTRIAQNQGSVRQQNEGKSTKVRKDGTGAHQSNIPGKLLFLLTYANALILTTELILFQLQGDKRRLEQELESVRRESQEKSQEIKNLKEELNLLR